MSAATVKRISLLSTIGLILLLLIFFLVTLFSTISFKTKIQTVTEHPFVVTRGVGDLKTGLAQIRIRTERLQSYNTPEDVETVRNSLKELYQEMDQTFAEIGPLFLGPSEYIQTARQLLSEIENRHQSFLDFAAEADHDKLEITAYEKEHLYSLYDDFDAELEQIRSTAYNTQLEVYKTADSQQKQTLIWSLVIVLTMIAGLLFFQSFLSRMNRKIYEKNRQFDILSQNIDETFLIFSPEKEGCSFVAENAEKVLGIPANILRTDRKRLYQLIDQEASQKIQDTIYQIKPGEPWNISCKYQNPKTGQEQIMLGRFYLVGAENGNHEYILTITDQTEDFRAREALQDALAAAENASAAKQDFLSRMSHEIRTPMNAIIGMTTIMAAHLQDQARIEDCLTKISYSSKHLLMLINDILDMSKIESGKMKLEHTPFDIYQFTNNFVSLIYQQVQGKGLDFKETITGFDHSVSYIGDPMRLNQILLNLLSNAIKFTDSGGQITLDIKCLPGRGKRDRIEFTLTDTGIGMSEDTLGRIFDPFEQADSTIAQKYGGTGLGMSITQNLVSMMGGHISVKSNLGQGTSVTVAIPFERVGAEQLDLSRSELSSLNVLVVDDEKDVCEHTTLLLAKMKIQASWVLSGAEAIERVLEARKAREDVDVCLIDWKMPEMDGIETTRRIRKEVGPDTPIIIISAYDWSEIEQEARDAGANAFIAKPLFSSSIYNMLVNVTNGAYSRPEEESVKIPEDLHGKRILIAEDNPLNLEITQELLKMSSILTEGAKDGKEAVDAFLSHEPGYYDAILMDIQMPVMDGFEATSKIRNCGRKDGESIPIIAATANAFTDDIAASLAAGMNAHVSKPIDIQQLSEVLNQYLK